MSPKYFLIVSGISASLMATPALSQDSAPAPAPAAKEKKTCRRQEVTGSIMPKSICHTTAQWAEIEQQQTRDADALRNRQSGSAGH